MKACKIAFYPNVAKKSSKTNLIPVFMRVSKNSFKTEARLDVSLKEEELKYWNIITQRLDVPNSVINRRLEEIVQEYDGLKFLYKNDFFSFTPNDIKEKILHLNDGNSLELQKALTYIENYYLNTIKPSQNVVEGTKINYRKAINHFTKYLKYINKHNCLLTEVSKEMAFNFYDYLQQNIIDIKKKSITDVSASSIVIKIKVIFKRAYDTDMISKNPFNGLALQTKSPKKEELNIQEINALLSLDLRNEKKLEVCRDVFMFCVYTGLSYSDVYGITHLNFTKFQDELLLQAKRNKTDVDIKQVLVKEACDLIMKYQNNFEANISGKIFPYRHLNDLNGFLKILQAKAGINKNLSTHIARHTCSQLLRDIGDINLDVINSMLGWSNGRLGASMVYRRTSNAMVIDAKNKFQFFLNENLCRV